MGESINIYHTDHKMIVLNLATGKEYGKADRRWLHSDPTVVSLEVLTVVITGTLALLLVYAIRCKTFYRYLIFSFLMSI